MVRAMALRGRLSPRAASPSGQLLFFRTLPFSTPCEARPTIDGRCPAATWSSKVQSAPTCTVLFVSNQSTVRVQLPFEREVLVQLKEKQLERICQERPDGPDEAVDGRFETVTSLGGEWESGR